MSIDARHRPQRHAARVLTVLRESGPLRRSELADRLGMKRTTLSEITSTLLASGALRTLSLSRPRAGRGRPATLLALAPDAGQYLGIDFGHRRVQVVIVNASHEIIADGVRRYDDDTPLDARLRAAFSLVEDLTAASGASLSSLQGIGIGVPGPYTAVALDDGAPTAQDVRPWGAGAHWKRSVLERVRDRFGVPVVVDNNVRFAALAEAWWDRTSVGEDAIYLRLSDGIGGAIVLGGRTVRGANGFGGELGHVTVDPTGIRCRCGKRGCLETVASVWAIVNLAREAGLVVDGLADLRAALDAGDAVAGTVVREVGTAVGRVLGLACIVLNPTEVVVGGESAEHLPELLVHASAAMSSELLPVNETRPLLRLARLGEQAGALGAVTAVLHAPTRKGLPHV